MKKGYSLMMAIIVLVIVAIMSVMILNFSSQTVKVTENSYLREQAELLARSSTEFAILALSGHNHYVANNGCVKTIDINSSCLPFEVNMSISYIVNGISPNWCDDDFRILDYNSLQYNESNITVMIDTIVTTTSDVSPTIRFHRRTIQKP